MNDAQMYYAIGYRDALAVLCAETRMHGADTAVRKAAEKLLEIDPEHCHAKVVLDQLEQDEKQNEEQTLCSSCGRKPGVPRIDNGVAAGSHCDTCWQELVSEARKRSW